VYLIGELSTGPLGHGQTLAHSVFEIVVFSVAMFGLLLLHFTSTAGLRLTTIAFLHLGAKHTINGYRKGTVDIYKLKEKHNY